MEETWTTDFHGSAHEGTVGVLLADGSVAEPVYFDTGSGSEGRTTREWSAYDGTAFLGPRAAAFRAVCSCGWAGPEHALDWESFGGAPLWQAGREDADSCLDDWDAHTMDVERRTVPVPEEITDMLGRLKGAIERLADESPAAAVKAARQMEIAAGYAAYGAAHDARARMSPEEMATALGIDAAAARSLLARYGGWSPYR
ncbi:hypothetical protein [Streptomyces sp. NPDC097619]|uniref:hypothetical protein n=1 Tax=Streptomyces sp. NPDC097619 TaxID=3157228 RepID=UPI00332F581A